ncbi:MAG: hypothetical protein ACPHF0_04935 [Poseidonia sp.]
MGRNKNSRSAKKKRRRAAGLEAQRHLSGILQTPQRHHPEVVNAAAVHLVKTSQRHRLSIPRPVNDLVCRKCWSAHVQSTTFRVRIKDGQRIKTCLKCGSIRRFGGGPKYHRTQRGGERHA